MDPVVNFGRVIASTGYDGLATTIVLAGGNGSKLPNPAAVGAFDLVWWNATDYADAADDPLREFIRVTVRSSDTLTVTRAQQSTSAVAHNIAGKTYKLELVLSKKLWEDLVAATAIRVNDVLDGTTNYKRVTIPGLTVISDAYAFWGVPDSDDPSVDFGRPTGGSVYVAEIGSGYVDVRATDDQVKNRRIKVQAFR